MNWTINQTVDLSRGYTPVVWPDALMVSGDVGAHTWRLTVLDNGVPADLSGANITGSFLRADGNTVLVSGTVSGNIASVTLTDACYAVEGKLVGTMRAVISGATVTLAAVVYTVKLLTSGDVVDPGVTYRDFTIDASPAGTYVNLAALIADDPDHSKIYITLDDGKWCYWNGTEFVAGGVYQAASVVGDIANLTSQLAENAAGALFELDNLVSNSGFESDLTGWTKNGIVTGAVETTHVLDGSKALRLTTSGTPGEYIQAVAAPVGHKVYAAMWVYLAAYTSGAPFVATTDYGGSTNAIRTFVDTTKVGEWQLCAQIRTVTGSGLQIRAGFSTATLSIVFDDAMVFDLTAMYGSGNEPTVSEFTAILAQRYAHGWVEDVDKSFASVKKIELELHEARGGFSDINGRLSDIYDNIPDIDISDINGRLSAIDDSISDINDMYSVRRHYTEYGGLTEAGGEVVNTIRLRTGLVSSIEVSKFKLIFPASLKFNTVIGYSNGSWGYAEKLLDGNILTLSADYDYVRFTFVNATNSSTEITEEEMAGTYVVPYIDLYEDLDKLKADTASLVDNLAGKKYAALGDSITYGFIPRNYAGYPGQLNSYAALAASRLGMAFANHGISGNTLATTETITNGMCVRYTSLPNDADIITFMGGTNDIRLSVPLGTMADRGTSTFYGALHTLCAGLYKKYFIDQGATVGKTKKVIALTPIKLLSASADSIGGTGTLKDMELWVDAIKEVAAYYSFPVLDFYHLSGINPHLNQTLQGTEEGYTGFYNPYITDGIHPTQEGAEIMSDLLVGFLKTLGMPES